MLERKASDQIAALLAALAEDDQRRLIAAMAAIREAVEGSPRPATFVLRPPSPGDLGWVVHRNGALYAEEYGWDTSYEALVARIVADYAGGADPAREAAWIAELDGAPAGCVFCMRKTDTTAQLRLAAAASWLSAWPLPAEPATRKSCCGPTTCSTRRAGSTSGPVSSSPARSRTTASGTTWSGRTGGSR